MKLLVVSPFPYGKSSGQGGATACSNALLELRKSFDLGVLCFDGGSAEEEKALGEMQLSAGYLRTVPLRIGKTKVLQAKLLSLLSHNPEHAFYFDSEGFRCALALAIRDFAPDIAMCQFPQMAQYLPLFGDIPVIQDVQDAFSVSWYRRAMAIPKGLKQGYAIKQWQNWVAYERKYYPWAAQCWTLSDQDKFGLTAFNPQLKVHTVGLPLIDVVKSQVDIAREPVVGFIGSYGHPPNVEALRYLLQDVVGRVSKQIPEVTFLIAGRNPPAALQQQAGPNVRFMGFVDSLDDFYGQCSVIVAPLLSGGGVKIKVAEALGYGKAVVTTSVGAEGMALEHGIHALVADDPADFALAVQYLLENEVERLRVARAAGELAQQIFSAQSWLLKARALLAASPQPVATGP